MKLYHASDTSIGAAFPAFPVNVTTGEVYTLSIRYKASAADADGFYIRIYEYDEDLPSGKVAVSHNASSSVSTVQEDTRKIGTWKENAAVTTDWQTTTFTYTPTGTANWTSIVVLNWSGMGTKSLFLRDPSYKLQASAGPQGSQGVQGATGSQGVQGAQGRQGKQGATGSQGVQGATGSQGVQGAQGRQGKQGATGSQGVQGAQGRQGKQGATGSGSQGHQGRQGRQGATGAQGVQGAPGSNSFNNLTGKTSGTGDYATTDDLVAGKGSGSIALTVNDSQGNANLTFNHQDGVPDVAGSSGRIECSVDSTTANMYFELGNSSASGVTTTLTTVMDMTTSAINLRKATTAHAALTAKQNSTSATNFSLHIRNDASGPAQIKFSNNNSDQNGYFFYRHEDNQSNSAGNSFHFNSTESSTAVIIDQTAGDSGFYVGTNEVFHDGYHPNADTLTTARTISLGGHASGSASFNGGSDVTISATINKTADQMQNNTGNWHTFVNDGGGNIGQRWNSSTTGTNTLVEAGWAWELEIENDTGNGGEFNIRSSGASEGTAGSTITWSTPVTIYPNGNVTINGNLKVADEGTITFDDTSGTVEKIVATSGTIDLYADAEVRFFESDAGTEKISMDVNNQRIFFAGDDDTYWYRPGSNIHGFAASGNDILQIGTTGLSIKRDITLLPNGGGDATASTTTKNSESLVFMGKHWDGSASVDNYFTISYHVESTDPTGKVYFGFGLDNNASSVATLSRDGTWDVTNLTYDRLNGANVSTRDKLRVWNSSSYSIGMKSGNSYGGLGGTGTEYAMTFQMSNSTHRGWWWGDTNHTDAQGAMSLTTLGKATIAHSLRLGYGESDTTVPGASFRLDVSGSANISGSLTVTSELNLIGSSNASKYIDCRVGDGNALHIRATSGGDANHEFMGVFRRNAEVALYYDNSEKFRTTSTGIKVDANSGNLGGTAGDSHELASFETNNANVSYLKIIEERDSNGTDWTTASTKIQKRIDTTDQAYIRFNGDGIDYGMEFGTGSEVFAKLKSGGAVELYYDNSKKFSTDFTGAVVSGALTVTGDVFIPGRILHTGDTNTYFQFHENDQARIVCNGAEVMEWGNNYAKLNDSDTLRFGSDSDFRIWFNGTDTYFRNYAHTGGDIIFQGEGADGNNENLMKLDTSTNSGYVILYQNNSEKFRTQSNGIKVSGNTVSSNGTTFGVGTNADGYLFKNAGTHEIGRNTAAGNGVLKVYGGAGEFRVKGDGDCQNTGGNYNPISSDERLKENIVDASSQWNDIKGIRFRNFNYKSNPNKQMLGCIAQELQQVCPNLVHSRPADEAEIADDSNTLVEGDEVLNFHQIPLLLKSAKALQEAIERIETLETQNTDLAARIAALENP